MLPLLNIGQHFITQVQGRQLCSATNQPMAARLALMAHASLMVMLELAVYW
jgi:hypothetical protein